MNLIKEEKKKCAMCNNHLPEELTNGNHNEIIVGYWLAPQTKEEICLRCNQINDRIALGKGDKRKGVIEIVERRTQQ